MPMKPRKGESQDAFMGRCMHELGQSDTSRPQDQKVAICMDYWRSAHGGKKPKKESDMTGRERHVKRIIARWNDMFGKAPTTDEVQKLLTMKQDTPTTDDCPEVDDGETQSEYVDRCVEEMSDDPGWDEDSDFEGVCEAKWSESGGSEEDAARGVIHKTHTASVAGMEFVLSDEKPDRLGDIIEVNGWQLDDFKNNPIALFNHNPNFIVGKWTNMRIEKGELRAHLELAPKGTSERIDEIRKLVEVGILKAVSVGFRGLKHKPIKVEGKDDDPFAAFFGPKRYVKQELVETSLVAVPANARALAVAKGLNLSPATIDLVFAEHGSNGTGLVRKRFTGEHADRRSNGNRRRGAMSLSQRIEDSQARLVAMRDELSTHLQNLDDTNVSDKDLEITNDLNDRIVAEQKVLAMLQLSEKNVAGTAIADGKGNGGGNGKLPVIFDQRRTAEDGVHFATPQQRANGELKPLDYLVRAGAIAIMAKALNRDPDAERRRHFGEDERTRAVFDWACRAATAPAMTTVTGWAAELVQQVFASYMDLLYAKSIFPRLAARGLALSFGRAGKIIIPTRSATPTIAGSFVGEGQPIPVRQGAFTAQTLTPKKMAVITTWTREMDEHSLPAIEGILRDAIQTDTGIALDSILIDANPATAVRPPGLLNGVTPATGTAGGGVAAIVGDAKTAIGTLVTNTKGNVRAPTWLANPGNLNSAIWAYVPNSGAFPFRAEVQAGNLGGIPIIDSGTVPLNTLILVDAADFVAVGSEAPRMEISDQATLHEEDTTPLPIVGGGGTAAAPVRSLWQTDSLALRMILPVNWTVRRAGVVAAVTGLTW